MRNPFRRSQPEVRAITDLPWITGGSLSSTTGTITQQSALTLAPVFAANRILAQSVSTLPVKAFRKNGDTREPMSKLPQLFDILQSEGQLVPWLHRCVTSLGLRGNAYGYVVSFDGFGFPSVIKWLNPTAVTLDESKGVTLWRVNGVEIPRDRMFHVPWFTLPGETLGLSPLGAFASTMNMGLNAQKYGNDWYAAGGVPPGKFKNSEQTITPEQATAVKQRLVAAIRTREPLVYGSDWDYEAIAINPGEAQFVESTRMTANQIAAIYGVPPEMIGGDTGKSMTYQNVEQQAQNFVTFTLRPWLVALESAFSSILPDRQYVKFNSDALIRADLKSRYEVYAIARTIGLFNVDDLRGLEDLPPLPNGQGQDYTPPVAAASDNSADATVTPIRGWANPQ